MGRSRESECCIPEARRRGRPVQIDQDRREELVLVATTELLSELRLDEVTMAAIAERAGMSKRTVYGMFENREALLGACMARIGQSVFRPLDPSDRNLPIGERLKRLLSYCALSLRGRGPTRFLPAAPARKVPSSWARCSLTNFGPRFGRESCRFRMTRLKPIPTCLSVWLLNVRYRVC